MTERDFIRSSPYYDLQDVITKIVSGSFQLEDILSTIEKIKKLKSRLRNSFRHVSHFQQKNDSIKKRLGVISKENGLTDFSEIFKESIDADLSLQRDVANSDRIIINESNIFKLLDNNLFKQLECLYKLIKDPSNVSSQKKLSALFIEGKRLYDLYIKDEEALLELEKQEDFELTEREQLKKNIRTKLWALIRQSIRVGVITVALLQMIDLYKKVQLPEQGHTTYENIAKVENLTGERLALKFYQDLKEISFDNTETLTEIQREETFSNLFAEFQEQNRRRKDVVKYIEGYREDLKKELRDYIIYTLKENEIPLDELGLSIAEIDSLVEEIAHRYTIYLYAEFFNAEYYSKLPVKNRLFLRTYITGGLKPLWSTQIEQEIVMSMKRYFQPLSNNLLHSMKKFIDEWAKTYRSSKIDDMKQDIKRFELRSFLKNFSKYMAANPIFIYLLPFLAAAFVIHVVLLMIPLTRYPYKITLSVTKAGIKKSSKFLFSGTAKDLKIILARGNL